MTGLRARSAIAKSGDVFAPPDDRGAAHWTDDHYDVPFRGTSRSPYCAVVARKGRRASREPPSAGRRRVLLVVEDFQLLRALRSLREREVVGADRVAACSAAVDGVIRLH